jgi:hypothetical protein
VPDLTLRREWVQTVVRVEFGPYAYSEQYVDGVKTLRKLENWFRENQYHRSMFDAWGYPKYPSGIITVTFPVSQAEKALAFRVFCNTLGLGRTLSQYRIEQRLNSRTTPPELRIAFT